MTPAEALSSPVPGFQLALYALLLFGAAAAGGLLPALRPETRRSEGFIFSFGSGILLGTAFLHMMPEAGEILGGQVGLAILGGFLSLLLVEKFVMVHPCEEIGCDFHHLGLSAYVGISLHSLIDGVALGASLGDLRLSLVVFVAILIHQIPCGFSLGSLLLLGRHARSRVIGLILLFAIMTPLGAVLTWRLASGLPESTIGWALGFSAGNFLFIATSDLLPQLHLHDRKNHRQIVWLLLGLAITALGTLLEH
jgi:zinc and cadmium transporter